MSKTENTTEKNFDDCLLDAIDEALSSLGESVRKAIYFKIDENFQIKRNEIPKRIEDFSDALEQIFGLGAQHLETMFMNCLHSKIMEKSELRTLGYERPEMTFKEYVKFAKTLSSNTQEPLSTHSNIDLGKRRGKGTEMKISALRKLQNIYSLAMEALWVGYSRFSSRVRTLWLRK